MSALPSDLAAPAAEVLADALASASTALRRANLRPLDAAGQAGTVFATLDGAAVAVVPLDLYRRLVSAAVASAMPAVEPARPIHAAASGRVRTSTIDRDPEVAAFLRERFGQHLTVNALRDACIERFGHARTPSHTRITILRQRSR